MMPTSQFQFPLEHAMDPAGYGFCTTTDDSYIQSLAKDLNETATQQGFMIHMTKLALF